MQPINEQVSYGNKFGFAEMYEWANLPKSFLGRLVQFSKDNPEKIELAKTTENILGITSINPGIKSSNPENWPYIYLFNEYEDLYLKKENIAIGVKKYDSLNEFSYISTDCQEVFSPIKSNDYNPNVEYIKRSNRREWTSVILIGKAIIEDNGECEAGKYCTLYQGEDIDKFGTVIPSKDTDKFKLYVLSRLSDKTILVFYYPQIYNI